jgi:hypothetical protein
LGREEGGTNVRQVWIEVKLLQVLQLKKSGYCVDALTEAKNLGQPIPGLPFTRDGLEPILNSARTAYLMGEAYAGCEQKTEAATKFDQVSKAAELPDLVWAWKAAKSQRSYDPALWTNRLQAGIQQAEVNSGLGGYRSWWLYTAGMLRIAAGQKERGQADLREVFLLPDTRLCHHLSRLGLAEASR